MKKVCSKCKTEKDIEEFSLSRRMKDGRQGNCKECKKEYREENREKISKRNKKYREENKEEISKRNKEYNEKNKEKNKKYQKEYEIRNCANPNKINDNNKIIFLPIT